MIEACEDSREESRDTQSSRDQTTPHTTQPNVQPSLEQLCLQAVFWSRRFLRRQTKKTLEKNKGIQKSQIKSLNEKKRRGTDLDITSLYILVLYLFIMHPLLYALQGCSRRRRIRMLWLADWERGLEVRNQFGGVLSSDWPMGILIAPILVILAVLENVLWWLVWL